MSEHTVAHLPVPPKPMRFQQKTLLVWALILTTCGIIGILLLVNYKGHSAPDSAHEKNSRPESGRQSTVTQTASISPMQEPDQETSPVTSSTVANAGASFDSSGTSVPTTAGSREVAPKALSGAILPDKRVIAYYGNLYSTRMGILGELPPAQMIARLNEEVTKWEKADPSTPVQPALHYIAVTAQGAPGKDGKYRLRMPDKQIDSVLTLARMANAIVYLDIQVGLSSLQEELPRLEKYLSLPHVHLGIDPEFSMKGGQAPGKAIGTFDAVDINYAIRYLDNLSKTKNLPPKMLVVHRFTQRMVTNAKQIKPTERVQVIMHMDGWGEAERKIGTYKHFIVPEPVQYTGFKIFYKNDTKRVNRPREMQPEQLLKLNPVPMYIQYQ